MNYRFEVTCPRCNNDLTHITAGTPGTNTSAIAQCPTCRIDWLLNLTIRPGTINHLPPGGGRPPAQCGTEAGYRAHRRRGEHACRECLDAKNAAKRARKQRQQVAG